MNDLITWLLKNGTALSLTIPTCGSKCAEGPAPQMVRAWDYFYFPRTWAGRPPHSVSR
ncbi:hypothetical protein ACQEU6_29160 [Spirillospora sp. CA-108201]